MGLVIGWGICDICGDGNQQTNFKCWWCCRYICENCESERVIIEDYTFGHYTHSCRECNEAHDIYNKELNALKTKYSKDKRDLEEKFLNSRLELNPKFKGQNIKWRDIAWST